MMGTIRLYQTVGMGLVVLALIFFVSPKTYAQNYTNPNCDGNCTSGEACAKTGIFYDCLPTSTGCISNCGTGGTVCVRNNAGITQCLTGTPASNTSKTLTKTDSADQGSDDQQRSIFGSFGNFFKLGLNYQGNASAEFFRLLYRAILPIAFIIGMIMVAAAGYTLMTSQGDPQRTQEGKEQLTSAIMGLLFVLLGAGILRALVSTLIQGADPGF